MFRLCLFVPVFLLGCPSSHGDVFREEEPHCGLPPGYVCCDADDEEIPSPSSVGCPFHCPLGSTLLPSELCGARPLDAGTVPPTPPAEDAGLMPPPVETLCPEARPFYVCSDHLDVPAIEPFSLPLGFGYGCCPEPNCSVSITRSGAIDITSTLCPDVCDCDPGREIIHECPISGLPAGDWTVLFNGSVAFDLRAIHPDATPPVAVGIGPTCTTVAPEESPECSAAVSTWTRSGSFDSVCVSAQRPGIERRRLELHSDCWSCRDQLKTCEVSLEPRWTTDLPPGGELRVTTRVGDAICDEDDCGSECLSADVECPMPDLIEGEYYRVWIDGELWVSFLEEDGRVCHERD